MRYMIYILTLLAAVLSTYAGAQSRDDHPALPSVPKVPFYDYRLLVQPPRTINMLFAGDVMQHMPQVDAARRADGTFDYSPVFEHVAPLFLRADLAVVNLETTLTPKDDYAGYPCFRSPEALAGALRDAGVGVCVMANNHCCDAGAEGIRHTLAALDRQGIARTGVFADSADYRAHHPLRLNAGGVKIALLNYTYGTNGIGVPKGMIVNRIDTVAIARDLQLVQDSDAECVVVFLHWGNEYERKPNDEQRRLAHFLRQHGADVIIGSHPHVVQPFTADASGVLFYSLGNFVSNQRNRYCDGGVMAHICATVHHDGRIRYHAEAVPVWVDRPTYRILPPQAAQAIALPPYSRMLYDRFIDDTRELLNR